MEIIKTNLQFNSNKTKRNLSDIKRAILHHSGVSVLQTVETIHNYHKNTRKYAGIGYHFYVRKDGTIYEGRPLEYIGAHAYGSNADSIGICAEGNFNEEIMSEVQKQSIIWLLNKLKVEYNFTLVQKHRDVDSTSCPGSNFPFGEIANGQATIENKAENKVEQQITYPLLKRGSKGNFVRIVQEKLTAKGYSLSKYGVDGDFGSETENAVKELQRDSKIAVDGIIGNDTWAVLNSDFVKPVSKYILGLYQVNTPSGLNVRKEPKRYNIKNIYKWDQI